MAEVMTDRVRYDVRDRVAVVTIDHPPVNLLDAEVWAGIEQGMTRALADGGVEAIVLSGAGSVFAAGADIRVFETLKSREASLSRSVAVQARLTRIEDATKPVIAAIRGYALGGGFELAQACHFRIATADATFGQPEVSIGLIPGAGGTQRLPRLCGLKMALRLCAGGQPVDAAKAHAAGILDQIVEDDLARAAIALARAKAQAGVIRKTREISVPPEDVRRGRDACRQARVGYASIARSTRARMAAIDAVAAALDRSFDAGLTRERELFAECVLSPESRALRHAFFARREAAKHQRQAAREMTR